MILNKRRFYSTKAVFKNDLDNLGIECEEEELEDFTFDLNEITAFNRSSKEGRTTIWFMGTSITIATPYEKIENLVKSPALIIK